MSLILKKEGNWTSRKVKSKPQHVFEDTEGKFIINWWTSGKTLNVQGDRAEEIEEKLDRLLVKAKNSQSKLVEKILEPPKPKKTKQAKKSANVKDALISCKVRISELEIKLRHLEAEKSSLQSQLNKLSGLNNELKQQVSLSNRASDDKSSKPEEGSKA